MYDRAIGACGRSLAGGSDRLRCDREQYRWCGGNRRAFTSLFSAPHKELMDASRYLVIAYRAEYAVARIICTPAPSTCADKENRNRFCKILIDAFRTTSTHEENGSTLHDLEKITVKHSRMLDTVLGKLSERRKARCSNSEAFYEVISPVQQWTLPLSTLSILHRDQLAGMHRASETSSSFALSEIPSESHTTKSAQSTETLKTFGE